MDLAKLIQYLLIQNRQLIQPELGNQRDYNTTKGNPPVALEDDGWLRSLIPYETGEGGPPGRYQDDGRTRPLKDSMWDRFPGLMRGYDQEEQSNKQMQQLDLGEIIRQHMQRQFPNRRVML